MAESCCSSGKQREGEGDRNGDGGEGDGWRDAEETGKEKGRAAPQPLILTLIPAWHRCLPPGSAAQLPTCCPQPGTRAERWWHHCQHCAGSPLLPPPRHGAAHQRGCGAGNRAEQEDEGGVSSSSRGSVVSRVGEEAPYPPPGHLRRGGGAVGLAASLPLPGAAEGDGMRWEDGCSAATRQRWRKHGRAGRAARPRWVLLGWGGHARRGTPRINPLPPPPRRELGVS